MVETSIPDKASGDYFTVIRGKINFWNQTLCGWLNPFAIVEQQFEQATNREFSLIFLVPSTGEMASILREGSFF